MRHNDVSFGGINQFSLQQHLYCLTVALRHFSVKHGPYISRLQKREKIKIHLSVFVLKCDFFEKFFPILRQFSCNVNPLLPKNSTGIIKPLRRIMVSADDQDRNFRFQCRKFCQKTVKNPHRLSRWYRLIIHIPRDHDRIRSQHFGILHHFPQDMLLIFF